MKLANEVITIFNHYLDEDTGYDKWIPTSIRGCSWYSNVESTVTSDGLIAANKVIIRIPAEAVVKDDKSYVNSKAYPGSDKTSSWTLAQGDIIVKGVETSSEMTPKEIQEAYSDVTTVLGVTDNRRAPQAKHWKVIGR